MQRWEHLGMLCLANPQSVAAAIQQKEPDGWQYVDHFDVQIPEAEVPPDLRGEAAPRQNGGAVLLERAQAGAKKTILGHFLLFKRPVQAQPEAPA